MNSKLAFGPWLFGVTLAVALASPVTAADEPTRVGRRESSATTLPKVRVQSDLLDEEPYVRSRSSTATKTDTPLRDVPQSITVIGSEVIADMAMQGMADAVRYVPGVTMGQGEGNRDQPTIRGNGTTADFFVDGIRDDTQYFRDLYNVERLEALKGPNAMIFGRGGGGGVINRVTKQADWSPTRAFTLQGGSYDNGRATVDVGQGINDSIALRFNGLYEESDSYRDGVELKRYALNPTASFALGESTFIALGYERFNDERTADRGIPSFEGEPVDTDESTFFGDPRRSYSDVRVDAVTALIEHETARGWKIRNRTRYADYDKFYQNVFPGAVNATGAQVSISAYNNLTERENVFNQTDVIFSLAGGGLKHTLLVGAEIGRQKTDNLRLTGFFNNTATSVSAPVSNPTISIPLVFRPNTNDANNHVDADVMAVYMQDQIELSPQWQAIVGLRYDNFDLEFRDNRNGQRFSRDDNFLSPRAGLVYKPVAPLSLYASYGVSFLPSSGDQFASLTATTRTLEPEEFANYEVGAKWDVNQSVALSAAVFQLDRDNTTAPGNTPGQIVQTGSQRTRGGELQVSGTILSAWHLMGGYAYQDAEIRRQTAAARAGATVPYTPKNTISLWNRYDLTSMWGVGLGVIYQDEMYAGIDNTVELPDFTRVDAAIFFTINDRLRAQVNLENLLDEEYFPTAHSNNNITPGSPTAVRVSLNGHF